MNYPLNEEEVAKLLYLEEQQSTDKHKEKVVAQMTEYYAKLIEYYDIKKDPIKFYFMDKMQKIVFDFNKTDDKLISESIINEIKNKQQDQRGSSKFKPTKRFKKQLDEGKNLYQIRKAQRETDQFLMHKLQKENSENKEELKKKISIFKKQVDQNTKQIESQLDSQKESIRNKLRRRRERSMSRGKNLKGLKSYQEISNKNNILSNLCTSEYDLQLQFYIK